jgi:hypothetical protein
VILQAIEKFLALRDMEELRKYKLGISEWNALDVCRKVLSVSCNLFVPITAGLTKV